MQQDEKRAGARRITWHVITPVEMPGPQKPALHWHVEMVRRAASLEVVLPPHAAHVICPTAERAAPQ